MYRRSAAVWAVWSIKTPSTRPQKGGLTVVDDEVLERWFVRQPTFSLVDSYVDGELVAKSVRCGDLVRTFVYDRRTGKLLGRKQMAAFHYFRHEVNGWSEGSMGKFVEMCRKRVEKAREGSVLKDGEFAKEYPALFDHLSSVAWDNGDPRVTSTLFIFVEDGLWKGLLNERESEGKFWLSGATFKGLLEGMEARLKEGTAEFRYPKPVGKKPKG